MRMILVMAALMAPVLVTIPAPAQTPGAKTVAAKAPANSAAEPAIVREARGVVAAGLKDPASAQFKSVQARNVHNLRGEPMQVVCGQVNAKNSFGGFAGFSPWIYLAITRSAHVLGPDNDAATVAMLANFCG
jgi:hypothetical protein